MGIKQRWSRHRPLPDDILERIQGLNTIFKEKNVTLAYLFGSLLNKKGEDVDIALLYDGDFPVLREEMQKKLGTWRLDIVNLKEAPVSTAFEVLQSGKLIYKINTESENLFELSVIKQYQDLRPVKSRQLKLLKENLGVGL